MTRNDLKKLLDSEAGKVLRDFLVSEWLELRNINNVKDCKTATAQALELKAQKKASELVKSILAKIITVPTEEEIGAEKENYYNF